MPKRISRETARAKGLTNYFTCVPCARGHVAERSVHSGSCNQCRLEKTRERAASGYFKKLRARHKAEAQKKTRTRPAKGKASVPKPTVAAMQDRIEAELKPVAHRVRKARAIAA